MELLNPLDFLYLLDLSDLEDFFNLKDLSDLQDLPDLDDFLGRSLSLVPWGTESAHLDVDALVEDLLRPRD